MTQSTVVHRISLLFILSLITFNSVDSQQHGIDTPEFNIFEEWRLGDKINNVSSQMINVIREFKPENSIAVFGKNNNADRVIPREVENDTRCDAQVELLIAGLRNSETWALQMVDSSSKIPTGILKGNIKDLGAYDECIAVKADVGNESISGRHCMYSISAKGSNATIAFFAPRLSICLPAVCSPQHVTTIIQNVVDKLSNYIGPIPMEINNVQCSSIDPLPFETGEIVTIVLFSLILCFLVGCTILDILIRATSASDPRSSLSELCKFSFYTNVIRIFDTRIARDNVATIHGIRFFSLCWVLLGHEYMMTATGGAINLMDAVQWTMSWDGIYILIAPFAVDTFFALGGFLISYLFMKEMSKGGKFNLIMYYVHRYIRLTPALAAFLLVSIYMIPRMGSGALWESIINSEKRNCEADWWKIILYVQNFVTNNGCMGHTWYLAVDMQLYWISPLILYPLSKKPRIGLVILVSFICASVITPAVLVGVNEYSAALVTRSTDITRVTEMMKNFYTRPYARAGAWLLGVCLGYVASRKRERITIKLMTLGWIGALLSFSFVFFTYRVFQGENYKWNAPWEIFYASLSRHIWALGVSWLIYLSFIDSRGVVTKFLSLPVFIPFGRISYCVYLVHMNIQSMKIGASRVLGYFNDLEVIQKFFGTFIFSCAAGLVLSLMFESPFIVLEKLIFRRNERRNYTSHNDLPDTEGAIGISNDAYNCDETHESYVGEGDNADYQNKPQL